MNETIRECERGVRWNFLGVVPNTTVTLKDRYQHQDPEITFGVVIFFWIFPKPLEPLLGLPLHLVGHAVESRKALGQVDFLTAGQTVSARQMNLCNIGAGEF